MGIRGLWGLDGLFLYEVTGRKLRHLFPYKVTVGMQSFFVPLKVLPRVRVRRRPRTVGIWATLGHQK